ncbi:MAG TPA: 5-methyltetrahydropteroyltriglutamate--homocysteine S-methyltransferase [Stellaceae bacterium]|jgi:5-methyltetrahydropteroyltriglutamate--homocysteine methyltransferase|nr:5-methyltetrahydropteroyltriglutamate--homocysteine S-methyltransferase [Stellaceae bacterium]
MPSFNKHPPFRADQVGSLVRPASVVAARQEFDAGKVDAAKLREAEDASIRAAVAKQEEIGLPVVTDGEFRRGTYSDSFTTGGIDGIRVELTEEQGWKKSDTHGHRTARRIPRVVSRIQWRANANAQDFAMLKSAAKATAKITLPGPAYIHYRAGRENIDRGVYPNLDNFWADLVAAYNQELRALYDAGCRYVQIDETSLVKLGDPRARQLLKERGDDWQDLLKTYVDVINRSVADAPADMHIAIHVCRSQDPSWQADVGYDPIADALFNRLTIGTYLLEYDNPRSGNFEPLRLLPKGKGVVLGLVAARNPRIETTDELKRRIEEASKFASLDQLALCPHCGFATSVTRSSDEAEKLQWQKLQLVVDTARAVWGGI